MTGRRNPLFDVDSRPPTQVGEQITTAASRHSASETTSRAPLGVTSRDDALRADGGASGNGQNPYAPDDLGERTVCDQPNGAPHVALSTAACRHLGIEPGDRVVFDRGPDGTVLVRRQADTDSASDTSGGQYLDDRTALAFAYDGLALVAIGYDASLVDHWQRATDYDLRLTPAGEAQLGDGDD